MNKEEDKMKKLVAFLGFMMATMGILFMYFTTVLQGNQILRYVIYFVLIVIWINSVAAVVSPTKKRRRR